MWSDARFRPTAPLLCWLANPKERLTSINERLTASCGLSWQTRVFSWAEVSSAGDHKDVLVELTGGRARTNRAHFLLPQG